MASSVENRGWLIAAAAGLAVFVALAADVAFHGRLYQADDAMDGWVIAHAGSVANLVALVLNDAGSFIAVTALVVGFAAFLLWRGRRLDAARVLACGVAVEVLVEGVKLLFHRPRPSEASLVLSSYSFPSGHATAAAMLACLAVWYAQTARRPFAQVFVLLAAGTAWALLVAWSRVALGVHHVTDVIAGLGLGLAIAALILTTRRRTP